MRYREYIIKCPRCGKDILVKEKYHIENGIEYWNQIIKGVCRGGFIAEFDSYKFCTKLLLDREVVR